MKYFTTVKNKFNSSVKKTLLLATALTAGQIASAQFGDKLKDGIKYYTDTKDSSHYIKFNVVNQIWMRYTEANPYTVVGSARQNTITDVSIRRIRFVMTGQLTDRIGIFVQFGQNNLNYLTPRKQQSFFHDVTADYAIVKKIFSLGFGLNGWNGPTRFSNISTSSICVLDPPGFQEVTNDTYDQFVRRLGIYAKGKIGKLDYRLSAAKPFMIGLPTSGASGVNAIDTVSNFATLPPQMVYQGYFCYQFLDQESNVGPSFAGTYLGKKKIFNIGAGFYYQDQAMFRYADRTKKDTVMEAMTHFGADIFYDTPLDKDKGTALSVYASYSNYNYGQNFIKVTGPDNPASGSTYSVTSSFNKANYGNAYPYLGTGQVVYMQAAYKFKDNLLGEQGTLQPYANIQYAMYNRLNDPMYVWDIGFNWLVKGHNSKFTFDYQNRPYFVDDGKGTVKESSRKGQFVMQYQIAF